MFAVPPKVSISSSFGDDPLQAGDLAQLQCTVAQGDTPVQITWSFQGFDASLNTQHGIQIKKFGHRSSILMIESVSAENSGVYVCTGSNHAGIANYTVSLKINGS